MAFFFRKANDKHVVLLKVRPSMHLSRPFAPQADPVSPSQDKHIHFATRSPSTTRAPYAARTSSVAPPSRRKRARTTPAANDAVLSSDSDNEGSSSSAAPAPKRRVGVASSGARDEGGAEDELVVVKPEPEDEGLPAGWADDAGGAEGLADVKEEIDQDVKPQVEVTCTSTRLHSLLLSSEDR